MVCAMHSYSEEESCSFAGEIHRLTLEPAAIDFLLEQLPWNYTMVKLPWMRQVLHVDWITN
jgi:hypothetical protein